MLKIGTVKWQGKCSRHPKYDPASDGSSADNCSRCLDLLAIYDQHQRTLQLMRTFAPPRRRNGSDMMERQQSLFG